jgi:lipopolysaccharide/colanic/teichoic acid biosynthesis glycosyltransferase
MRRSEEEIREDIKRDEEYLKNWQITYDHSH